MPKGHTLSLSGPQLLHLFMDLKKMGTIVLLEDKKCHLKHMIR